MCGTSKNFLRSQHVIKPSICPCSWIPAQTCIWCVPLTSILDKRYKVECSVAIGNRRKTLDLQRDRRLPLWRHRVSRVCVFNLLLSVSLFSASRGEKDGYFYGRCPYCYGLLKGPRGNVNSNVLVIWITSSAARDNMSFMLRSHLARSMEVPCLVARDPRSEEISSRSMGSLVNPENTDKRKSRIASRKLVLQDQLQRDGDEKNILTPIAQGNLLRHYQN